MLRVFVTALALGAAVTACTREKEPIGDSHLVEFATRYTAAWCSHNASSVAAFYSESGSLAINDGTPAVGRQAVEAAAQSFMTAYPDLVVKFDRLEPKNDRVRQGTTTRRTGIGKLGGGDARIPPALQARLCWADSRVRRLDSGLKARSRRV